MNPDTLSSPSSRERDCCHSARSPFSLSAGNLSQAASVAWESKREPPGALRGGIEIPPFPRSRILDRTTEDANAGHEACEPLSVATRGRVAMFSKLWKLLVLRSRRQQRDMDPRATRLHLFHSHTITSTSWFFRTLFVCFHSLECSE